MSKLPMKALRVLSGMNQQQVADMIGVSRSTYASWECYKTYPTIIYLVKLADAFKCTIDDFYFPIKTS